MNFYCDGIKQCFLDFSKQPRNLVHFYGDSGTKERSIEVVNSVSLFFENLIKILEKKEPWIMAEYDTAKEELCKKYPSVRLLWLFLGEHSASF